MKIGFVCMPLTGHLHPMTALARKLESRGHDVVFICLPDAETIVRAANLSFVPFGEKEYPVGTVAKEYAGLAKLHGTDVLQHSVEQLHPARLQVVLEQLPEKLKETRVEALVIDTIHFFSELVPMSMGIPYVHVWNVLHVDTSGSTPPGFFSLPYDTTPDAVAKNLEALRNLGSFFAPLLEIAQAYAGKTSLQIDWTQPSPTLSKLAIITQTPRKFDFPIYSWPPQFRYAGPLHDGKGREEIPFPWEKLTGEPLIYASLGTLVNGLEHIFRTILEAVAAIPKTQLVLSIGNNINPNDLSPIPSNAIVVSKAPQIELLKRAALCITHAGLNTTLESLVRGVPMVAIPIGFDQPGVAARIAYHGVGEFIEVEDLTTQRLTDLIRNVQSNPAYRAKALYFQNVIGETHGLDAAANIVEEAFR